MYEKSFGQEKIISIKKTKQKFTKSKQKKLVVAQR